MTNFLWWFAVGPLAGWLTGRLMRTEGWGWIDALSGLVGGIAGGIVLDALGIVESHNLTGTLLAAAGSAAVFTFVFCKLAADRLRPSARSSARSYTSYKSRMGK